MHVHVHEQRTNACNRHRKSSICIPCARDRSRDSSIYICTTFMRPYMHGAPMQLQGAAYSACTHALQHDMHKECDACTSATNTERTETAQQHGNKNKHRQQTHKRTRATHINCQHRNHTQTTIQQLWGRQQHLHLNPHAIRHLYHPCVEHIHPHASLHLTVSLPSVGIASLPLFLFLVSLSVHVLCVCFVCVRVCVCMCVYASLLICTRGIDEWIIS